MSLNKVLLIGNVGKDPEIRYIDNNSPTGGTKVASFPLATSERYRDRNGEQRENTEWHNIQAWRSQADYVEKYITKGAQLYIEGRIRTRSWTDQTGSKRYSTEIQADNIQILGRRTDGQGNAEGGWQGGGQRQQGGYQQPGYQQGGYQQAPQQNYPQQPAQQEPVDFSSENNSDDLPF